MRMKTIKYLQKNGLTPLSNFSLNSIFIILSFLLISGCKPDDRSKDSGVVPIPKNSVSSIQDTAIVQKNDNTVPSPVSITELSGPIGHLAPSAPVKLSKRSSNPLDNFFHALNDLETGRRARAVRILQLGDSHTAGDRFSGRLRSRFQERFGDGGRGLLPVGVPYIGYRPAPYAAAMSSGWRVYNSFNAQNLGAYGVTGFRLQTAQNEQNLSLTAQEMQFFDRAELEILQQPNGGLLQVTVDGEKIQEIETAGPNFRAERISLNIKKKSHKIEIITKNNRPVDLISLNIEKSNPGILLDSVGISGATQSVIERWDASIVDWELKNTAPDLIIFAYGTNEGFAPDVKPDSYEVSFAAVIDRLKQSAPMASILIVGPPDGEKQPQGCGPSPLCIGEEVARTNHRGGGRCAWIPPSGLALIRQAQKHLAIQNNYGFWDWSRVMGGSCGTHRWAQMMPPLARPDHIHFTADGYLIAGDALFDDLMGQYKIYKQNQPHP